MSPTRTMAAALAIVGVACAALAFTMGDGARPAVARSSTGARAAAWSARRVPQPIVDAVGAQRLQTALTDAVGATPACVVVDSGGAAIASIGSDLPLIPASTQKILTSTVALAVLGPEATLATRVVVSAAPADGVVEKLFMVGGGDALLGTPALQAELDAVAETRGTKITPLAALADGIVAAGVKRVPGGIVADDSRYENLRYLPTWKDSYRTDGQVGPVGALTVDRGFRVFRPQPDPVEDPGLYAAEQLTTMLTDRGVTVGRPAGRGTAPAGGVEVAAVASAPIAEVVATMLRNSDNLTAEMLLREIGVRSAQAGTTDAGATALVAELGKLGIDTTGAVIVDGSGLDRGDRTTCHALAAAVGLGVRSEFAALWNGLPVAGQSGTLVDEFRGTPLEGKLRAKTGSLDGVTGLAGLVDVGRSLRFAFVANGAFTERAGVDLRARIAAVIATYPDAPSADTLVPRPDAAVAP
ncbi:MAG TPA: D-alanyl-D-alanine carboxypeptidase/D-alanyl-D-alanine-endopeptidase [Acidimicrobiia bacterium]|nr:D-alanyl-D-alanine carboxypeptidase/D-alanyl-D-alanine-endopeptidase [Acidimicrobiia bacterium]